MRRTALHFGPGRRSCVKTPTAVALLYIPRNSRMMVGRRGDGPWPDDGITTTSCGARSLSCSSSPACCSGAGTACTASEHTVSGQSEIVGAGDRSLHGARLRVLKTSSPALFGDGAGLRGRIAPVVAFPARENYTAPRRRIDDRITKTAGRARKKSQAEAGIKPRRRTGAERPRF